MYPLGAHSAAELLQVWGKWTLLVESAGLFWIFAELAVLFTVLAARHRLENRFLKTRLIKREIVTGLIEFSLFLLMAAIVIDRHFWPGTALVFPDNGNDAAVLDRFSRFVHVHLAIWSIFVTIWVLLECLIVYHGYRAYVCLCRRFGMPHRAESQPPTAALLTIVLLVTLPTHADSLLVALHDSVRTDAVYWNALFLYLRLAGVVWILAEWFAAFILWRTWRLLVMAQKKTSRRGVRAPSPARIS